MANKYMKRWSLSSVTREMQMKVAMRYHVTRARMATAETTIMEKIKCWPGRRETGPLMHCWQNCETVQLPWETVFLVKLNTELLITQRFYTYVHNNTLRSGKRVFNKNLSINVQSNTSHKSRKAGTIPMPVYGWADKSTVFMGLGDIQPEEE